MAFLCPSCNASTSAEARFCRLCGAPLKTAIGSSGPISPLAQTVPLSVDGRTTDGLPLNDPQRNPNTARVGSGEIETLLHSQRLAQQRLAENGDGFSASYDGEHYAAPTTSSLVLPAPLAKPKGKRWWPVIVLTLFLVMLTAGLLVYYLQNQDANTAGNSGIAPLDQKQLVAAQLGEARVLLAANNTTAAIDKLQTVVNLDPANVEAHRMLGAAFMYSGKRRQAIDAYFAAAQRDPQDVDTLRTLAALQFQEQLYADAVDSHRRLAKAMGDNRLSPKDQLEYADALRMAGYTEDARNEYQKLIASGPAEIAAAAKKQMAQLLAQTAASLPANTRSVVLGTTATTGAPVSSGAPAPVVPNPATIKPAPASAQTGPDADYALGVSIVGGRDPKNMPRPELLRALGALQRAAQGGQHRDQARQLAERLGREFDRRRSQGIQ